MLDASSSPVEITPTSSDVEVAQASGGTVEVAQEAPEQANVVEAPAAPRNRRRTTRRPTGAAAAATPGAEAPPPAAEEMPPTPTTPESDIVAPAGESGSTNGAAPTEEAPAAPRPRRVASATRG